MPTLTIDGKQIEVPKGTRVIEAARRLGNDVPYYCYHPGLSIAGNCRMCLVEIEKMPRLQIACHMEAQDGMVVKTNTEKILKTRQHVLEFLLVNHPLDCPVCDQAGECWLQDYYMKHGLYDSRVAENKVKKPKAVSIGPTVMLDAERCILCSRCVRFTDEISKTHELGIVKRGDHSEISVFSGKELDNPYSGNVVDICPVGALTDKDFRFKVRVWYLKSQDSICNGCSRGCNVSIQYSLDRPHHAAGARVMRLKPRYNENINKWWMCDEGRYGYKFHDQNRILKPMKGKQELSWEHVLSEAAERLRESVGRIGVFLSPQLSNEELYLAKKLFTSPHPTPLPLGGRGQGEGVVSPRLFLVSPNPAGFQDVFLIRADKNPNSKGAELLGLKYDDATVKQFFEECKQGKMDGVIVFGQDLIQMGSDPSLRGQTPLGLEKKDLSPFGLKWVVFIGSNKNLTSESATYVLPSATYAEKEGTFTNFEGRVQKFNKVLEPLGEAKAEWEILITLANAVGAGLPRPGRADRASTFDYRNSQEIFLEMAETLEPFRGLTYGKLESGGSDIRTLAAPVIPALEQEANIL